jgi:hypothetical protein
MTKSADIRRKTCGDPMIDIVPTGKILGATVNGMDLSQALADAAFDQILRALGRYGVLRFPDQALKPAAQKAFASRSVRLRSMSRACTRMPNTPRSCSFPTLGPFCCLCFDRSNSDLAAADADDGAARGAGRHVLRAAALHQTFSAPRASERLPKSARSPSEFRSVELDWGTQPNTLLQ